MTEQGWAEGSGSIWEDLNGDPRITVGAEVLVGVRGADRLPEQYRTLLGSRGRVFSTGKKFTDGGPAVDVCIGARYPSYAPRDLVCLKTADGTLTEEGRALESLDVHGHKFGFSSEVRMWLAMSGIWRLADSVDSRRLAMALGREPKNEERLVDGDMEAPGTTTWKAVPATESEVTHETWAAYDVYPATSEWFYFPSDKGRPLDAGDEFRAALKFSDGWLHFQWEPEGLDDWEDVTGSMWCDRRLALVMSGGLFSDGSAPVSGLLTFTPHSPGRMRCCWKPTTNRHAQLSLQVEVCPPVKVGTVANDLVTDQYRRIQAIVVAHRCITCADCDTSTEQYPCKVCNTYSHWSKAAPAEAAVKERSRGALVQFFGWVLSPAEVARVTENQRTGKFSCTKCLSPIDHDGLCEVCAGLGAMRKCIDCGRPLNPVRDRFDLYGRCADCGFYESKTADRQVAVLRREAATDYSGEAVLDDLRRFVAGPCGKPR